MMTFLPLIPSLSPAFLQKLGVSKSSHIWSKNIRLWSNESFVCQIQSIFSSNSLKLSWGIFRWIKSNSTFGSTEWNTCNGKFESHKRSKCNCFLKSHVWRVSSSSFDWHEMMLMLSTIACKDLDLSIVSFDRNLES